MFKENLRHYREKAGMTAKAVADRVGIPPTTYRNYESVGREPTYEVLKKIAAVLHVGLEELLADEEERSPVYLPEPGNAPGGILDRGLGAVGTALLETEETMLLYNYRRAPSQAKIQVHRILDKYNPQHAVRAYDDALEVKMKQLEAGELGEEAFKLWENQATDLKKRVIDVKLSIDEFEEWLKEN